MNRRKRHSGIYKIEIEGWIYIGKSTDVFLRWSKHLTDLFANKHHNENLQKIFDESDYKEIRFTILKLCKKTELVKLEKEYIILANKEKLLNKVLYKSVKDGNITKETT